MFTLHSSFSIFLYLCIGIEVKVPFSKKYLFPRHIGNVLAFCYLIQNPGTWEFKGLNAQS